MRARKKRRNFVRIDKFFNLMTTNYTETTASLYLVSTPIGSLNDITLRAQEVLARVEIILAEDTRKTGRMLRKMGIGYRRLVSYYEENEARRIPEVINWLKEGKEVALVSNSGTPLISDPGYKLVREAVKQGLKVIPVPGASAVLSSLVVSGFPINQFVFLGFLPKKEAKKRKRLEELGGVKTVVFYESPQRIVKTLEVVKETLGNIKIALCRELTKIHEKVIRGNVDHLLLELKKERKIKGEITVVLFLER